MRRRKMSNDTTLRGIYLDTEVQKPLYKKEQMPFYVYGLVDPRSGEICYIGQTKDVKRRLAKHVNPSGSNGATVKVWLKELRAAGLRPEVVVIHTCATRGDALRLECAEIESKRPRCNYAHNFLSDAAEFRRDLRHANRWDFFNGEQPAG
jgi:hypothetical protein